MPSLHSSLKAYKLRDEEAPEVRAYIRAARAAGLSGPEIEVTLKHIYRDILLSGNYAPEAMLPAIQKVCEQQGIEWEIAHELLHFVANNHQLAKAGQPIDPGGPLQTRAELEEQLRQTREIMHSDRARYDANKWIQIANFDAIDLLSEMPPDEAPRSRSVDAQRKADIQQLMKTNIQEYWASGLDKEYTQLLEREQSSVPSLEYHEQPNEGATDVNDTSANG